MIERRIRRETTVRENQFGFMPRRSTTEAIHLLRRVMESIGNKRKICIWCSSIWRKRMIPYHEASSRIASRIEVFHRSILRQYRTCMTKHPLSFIRRWVRQSLSQLEWVYIRDQHFLSFSRTHGHYGGNL